MKCLVDQGLPRDIAVGLREAGWDVVHVGEIGLARASDPAILQRAKDESRVVLTLDSDFHQLLALSGGSQPSVVRFRDEGLSVEQMFEVLVQIETRFNNALIDGAVASVRRGRCRLRRLPLVVSDSD